MLMLRCYEDAPADHLGRMTPDRAMKEATLAAYANEKVVTPLTDESAWMQTLVILNDGEPIGINCAKAIGKDVYVLNQAFVPEWRGKRLFGEMQTLLQTYAFKELGAESASYDIRKRSIPALAHVQNRSRYEHLGDDVSLKTGEALHVGRITRDAWAVEADGPVPRDDAGGSVDRAADPVP
jgi:hypothetical protein